MSETAIVKTGWWASKSTGAKAGIVFLGLVGTAVIAWTVNKFVFKKDKPVLQPTESDTKTVENTTVEPTNIAEQQPHVQAEDLTLPNKGVGCSEVKTTYDRDYDYVKCAGVWYTRSKSNPSTASAKGKYPNWTSLVSNKIASKMLDTRYPNIK